MQTATSISDTTWMKDASCLDEDPEIFWLDNEDTPEVREVKTLKARQVCRNCPVWEQCRLWGLFEATSDRWSILGGLTNNQRHRVRKSVGLS